MLVWLVNPSHSGALVSEASAAPRIGTGNYPPLGLLYLQASLERDEFIETRIVDANLNGSLNEALRQSSESPNLIGITALTPNMPNVVALTGLLKMHFPQTSIVLGGPHVDLFPQETIKLKDVDFALLGEGETSILELSKALRVGHPTDDIVGVVKPDDAQSFRGTREEDVDLLPSPDRGLSEYKRYSGMAGRDIIFTTMLSARGCPYRCAFCSTPKGGVRRRKVEAILDEMEHCAWLGIEHIYFIDDTFPTDERRLDEFCTALHLRRRLPEWSCRTAVAGLNENALRRMKNAGCVRVQIGVETSSDEGLRVLKKPTDIAAIQRAMSAARSVGMETVAYFMIGLPHEKDAEQIEQTIRFARSLRPTYAMFNILTLYPGTKLYADARERGVIAGDPWQRFAVDPQVRFQLPVWDEFIERERLFSLLHQAYRSFYFRPSVIWRQLLSGDRRSLIRKAKVAWSLLLNRRGLP